MGRKLDLSGLTDNEAEHVLQVVQRDMKLRKKEEKRLSELKQELDEEGSRCLLLSRQRCFNQRCCIRCCLPFTFLLNPKRQCRDCRYNVCKACRLYHKQDKAWVCSACQKSRLLKTQSLEWFYTNVKTRFKRFGSVKVLKTLYRKHLAEHRAPSELTEGSAYEESVCNEGSVCGSDSTFYRQSEEHSMAETLSVALRVAEEAIDEAIDEAEFDTASQEKQDEAHYLREHRGELIDELAKTIVQKIINRRKTLTEVTAKYDQDWPLEQNPDPHHLHHHPHHQSICDQPSCFIKHRPDLWRSHSAFSLLSSDAPGLVQDSLQALMKEGSGSMSAWKSADRLDNAGVSSVLKSPDGNWIALQSVQLSRPSLLTKRKSLVFSALERESGAVSAYEGMDSDNKTKPEPDSSWGAALQEIHRKMTDSNSNLQDTRDRIPSPLMGRRGSGGDKSLSDSEGNWKLKNPLLAHFKRKVPAEIRRPSASQRTSIIDVNFNVGGATEEEEEEEEERSVAAEPAAGKVRRSRKKRKSNKVAASSVSDFEKKDDRSQPTPDVVTSDTLTCGATTPEPFDLESDTTGHGANQTDEELTVRLQQLTGRVSESSSTEEEELDKDIFKDSDDDGPMEDKRRGSEDRDEEEDESLWKMEIDMDEGRVEDENAEDERDVEVDEDMKYRLYRLVAQSRLAYFSSTDDELDRVGQSEGEWDEGKIEQEEEKTEGLTYKLCRLEKEVRASQFSSTEDELDRVGVDEKEGEEGEGDGINEELAVKVCRLANQVNATQFSSTEDELDRMGGDGDGEQGMDEEPLWKLEAEKALQAAQLRDLASLVSAAQFSSTEDELDRVEKHEGEREQQVNEGEIESSFETDDEWGDAVERKESLGDLDVTMFDLRGEIEGTKSESGDERATAGNVLDYLFKKDDVQETEAEKTEEMIDSNETGAEQGNQLEPKWPDENEDEEEAFEESEEGKWDATGDSEEEDAEFDRIISSMLTMTLEDMQVETSNDSVAEIGRIKEEPEDMDRDGSINKTRGGSGFTEKMFDAQSTNASEETGSEKEFQSHGNDVRSENVPSRKEASEETASRNKNEQEEQERDPQERRNLAPDTNEPQQEDGRGTMSTEGRVCETQGAAADGERERKERDDNSEDGASSLHEGFLSPEEIQQELYETMHFMSTLLEQRYSAVSLRSITTEVLKVLNATEELLQGFEGDERLSSTSTSLPPDTDPKKLDHQFSRLEENVYVAAGSVFGLEAELGELEECARGICSSTSDMELSFLEEQVASAAAKVQQSELQICDISARIAALKSAGLNVDTQSRFTKTKTIPVMPVTLDTTRQLRRRLPAPPVKEDKEA